MLRLKVLGSGSFSCDPALNFHSMYMLEWMKAGEGYYKRMLLDCGSDFKHAYYFHKESLQDIDAVYVSHLHGDHVGGIEFLALMRYFSKSADDPKAKIYGDSDVLRALWNNTLSGGLDTLASHQIKDDRDKNRPTAQLDTYFEPWPIRSNKEFTFEGVLFSPVQILHIVSGRVFKDSYGLFIDTGKTRVFWTADSQFAPAQMIQSYNKVDLIIHDCETQTQFTPSGVHAHYDQLVTLNPKIKAKMWLTHYNDNPTQDAIADGFLGFLQRGQIIDIE